MAFAVVLRLCDVFFMIPIGVFGWGVSSLLMCAGFWVEAFCVQILSGSLPQCIASWGGIIKKEIYCERMQDLLLLHSHVQYSTHVWFNSLTC